MDFDPHDYDPRDDRDRDHWRQPETACREHDNDTRALGRGPGDNSRQSESDTRRYAPRDDARYSDRDRDIRERESTPRDVFTRSLELPRGLERELARHRDREYTLRGSESRTLATVGVFRVVSSSDLRDHRRRPADPRSGDLRHLREQGLIQTVRVPGYREQAVVLRREGRSLLEGHRDRDQERGRPSMRASNANGSSNTTSRSIEPTNARRSACRNAARVDRVVLDYELKREYQKWLHERDRDRPDHDGKPDRTDEEIRAWALEHDLPYFDGEVHFPDVRIEYEDADGRRDHQDVEVTTEHYRGAHGASVARTRFSCHSGISLRLGGGGGSRGRGGRNGGLAEELIR